MQIEFWWILFRPTRTSMRRLYLRSGEGAWRLSASWQLHPEVQGEQEKPWQFGEGLGRFPNLANLLEFRNLNEGHFERRYLPFMINQQMRGLEWIVRLGVQNVSKTFCQLKLIKNAKMPMKLAYLHGENLLDIYDEVKLWDLIRSSGLFERCKQRVDIQTFVLWDFLVIKPAVDKYFEAQVLGETGALRLA